MLKAIIVDDEQHCISRLTGLLQEVGPDIKILASCNTISEAKMHIEKYNPDVLFLDVQLGSTTGFDLLSQLNHLDFELIFTTSFDTYALKAIKFSALDYLLKPIAKEDLHEALQKVRENRDLKETTKKIDVLFHNFKEGSGHSKRIAIPTVDGFVMVDTNDMVRLQSDANYTHIHTLSNKKITASKTLKYFEGILDGSNFFRVHKSHLINLSFVEHYLKGKGGYITLTDGAKIEVAVRRRDELIKKLIPNS
ncbi:LytR/AlgR family response regulator transcription factor [Flagellimonas aequoris]|uniref:DNA-binding response regulator n=1 Tax=Flagellimonas aequoris TaxID=2306997 RepID=A0A418NAH8_9FLAO|nr:LytTR family DNA-binding domain-containing protein [Allomuricauda aequoris]RIV73135.1 DNA-binding response regulator [Allomuricauda aequoris]TXK06941.1 response regulator transcription factor [Allomuricauda aequoris]